MLFIDLISCITNEGIEASMGQYAYCEHILKFRLLNLLPLHPKTRIVNPFPLEMFPLKQSRLKLDWSGNAIVASECLKSSFHHSQSSDRKMLIQSLKLRTIHKTSLYSLWEEESAESS